MAATKELSGTAAEAAADDSRVAAADAQDADGVGLISHGYGLNRAVVDSLESDHPGKREISRSDFESGFKRRSIVRQFRLLYQ